MPSQVAGPSQHGTVSGVVVVALQFEKAISKNKYAGLIVLTIIIQLKFKTFQLLVCARPPSRFKQMLRLCFDSECFFVVSRVDRPKVLLMVVAGGDGYLVRCLLAHIILK